MPTRRLWFCNRLKAHAGANEMAKWKWKRKWKRPPPLDWKCGHLRTPANSESKGDGAGFRCKECRKVYKRDYYLRTKDNGKADHGGPGVSVDASDW